MKHLIIQNLTKYLFVVLVTLFSLSGCRKNSDVAFTNPQDYKALRELFFNTSTTNDVEIKKLANDIAKQEATFKFLPEFIKKNGIPKWDKVRYKTANTNITATNQVQSNPMGCNSILSESKNNGQQGLAFIFTM